MASVYKSTIIQAPIARVWAILRDFNGHDGWHPAVADSVLEAERLTDQVGCVRRFSLRGGSKLREQLLSLSDRDHTLTYCIVDSEVPLYDYVASVRLRAVTDGDATFWEWKSRFNTPPGRESELTELVGTQVYEAGFESIRLRLEHPERQLTRPSSQAIPTTSGASISCKALVLQEFGGPEQLRWQDVTSVAPGPGQVRIKHSAIGVNFIDIYCRTGYFRLVEPPAALGMEAAGTVIDVGEGVHGLLVGDRVAYACPPVGAYSEYRTMDSGLLVLLPDDVADDTAAAFMLKGMTAEFLLHRVHSVGEGDAVLVHAAAGGVGSLLCQWARALGAEVIGTVGSEAKLAAARSNGCSYPILYRERDFVAEVMDITSGRGVDVVYDAVGRDTFLQSYEALAIRGHLVSYGQASGPLEPIDIGSFAGKSVTVSRPNYAHYTSTTREVRAISDRLFDAFRQGVINMRTAQRFALRDGAEAHRQLEERATVGSLLLLP